MHSGTSYFGLVWSSRTTYIHLDITWWKLTHVQPQHNLWFKNRGLELHTSDLFRFNISYAEKATLFEILTLPPNPEIICTHARKLNSNSSGCLNSLSSNFCICINYNCLTNGFSFGLRLRFCVTMHYGAITSYRSRTFTFTQHGTDDAMLRKNTRCRCWFRQTKQFSFRKSLRPYIVN